MRLLAGLVALAAIATAIGPAEEARAARRVALVIGNSSYKYVGGLPNPASDASAIADLLNRSGFDVGQSKKDLTSNDMRRTIRDFSDKTRDADIAVVFYAGHGIEVDGTNYLLPVDAALARDTAGWGRALPLARLAGIREPVSRRRLLSRAACRDTPFLKTMKRTV